MSPISTQSANAPLIAKNINYELNRSKLKNNLPLSIFIFFKACMGLGLISTQMYYFQTGYILGIVITTVITILVAYNMTLLNDLSLAIEQSVPDLVVDTYEHLPLYVFDSTFWARSMHIGALWSQSNP